MRGALARASSSAPLGAPRARNASSALLQLTPFCAYFNAVRSQSNEIDVRKGMTWKLGTGWLQRSGTDTGLVTFQSKQGDVGPLAYAVGCRF